MNPKRFDPSKKTIETRFFEPNKKKTRDKDWEKRKIEKEKKVYVTFQTKIKTRRYNPPPKEKAI